MIWHAPKILICLPTFHSEIAWLERSTESVSKQTYANFDCCLVKDACTKAGIPCLECDNCRVTVSFCQKLAKKDKRFKFFNLPLNCGGAGWGPRNFAIQNTKHDLIAYLDDDNWYESNHLELLLEALKSKDSDMAYTGTRLVNKNGAIESIRIHPYEPKQGYIDTSEILHKRFLIEKYGGWRWVKKGNDWDIVSRWIPGLKWSHTNQITLNFYLREGCGVHRT